MRSRFIYRVSFWVICGAALVPGVSAQDWSVTPSDFDRNMSHVIEVQIGGIPTTAPGDRVAAFVGDDVRGVVTPTEVGEQNLFFLLVYANGEGETITFKYFDSTSDRVLEFPETSLFNSAGTVGEVASPFVLTAEPPETDPNAWNVNPADFPFNSSIVASVFVDGVESDDPDDVLAAFTGTEIRGVASSTLVQGRRMFFLTVYGRSDGEQLTFRLFDASEESVRDILESREFESNQLEGTFAEPLQFNTSDASAGESVSGWSVNAASFQYSMSVVALVQFEDSFSNDPDDLLAAFSGSGIRGVAASEVVGDRRLFFLTIHSNSASGTHLLRGFDNEEDRIWSLSPSIEFVPDGTLGTVANPLVVSSSGGGASGGGNDDPATWNVNESLFQSNMTVVASIAVDGIESDRSDDMLAAFIDEEIRGVTQGIIVDDRALFFLTIHSNVENEEVTFRAFDSGVEEVRVLNEVLTYRMNATEGTVSDPLAFNAIWPAGCVPDASIVGDAVQVVRRSQSIVLLGQGSLPACAIGDPDLQYEWQQIAGPAITLQNPNQSAIQIPSATLTAGASHVFELKVSVAENSSISSTALVTVNVERSPLVASIAGGNRSVSENNSIVLDASESHDPDTGSPPSGFIWTCTDQSSDTPCENREGNPVDLPEEEVFTLAPLTLDPGTYVFEVTVTEDARTAAASIEITVVSGAAPLVSISASYTTAKFNTARELVLTGTATSSAPGSLQFEWNTTGVHALDLNDAAVSSSGPDNTDLVILAGVLDPGIEVRFRLTVTDAATNEGFAEWVVVTNAGATGGAVASNPTEGTAFTTQFLLSAPGWEDDDEPLTYQFLALRQDGTLVPLSDRVARSSAVVTLPRGDPDDGDELTVLVRIVDGLGTSTVVNLPVIVHPPPASVTDLTLTNDLPDGEETEEGSPRVPMDQDLSVDGLLELIGLDLDLNGNILDLGETGTLDEDDGSVTGSGTIRAQRNLDAPAESNVAGIGIGLVTGSNLGQTTIDRQHESVTLPGGSPSIRKKFAIEPETQPAGGITITIRFTAADLIGHDPEQLICFFFDDVSGEWTSEGVVVVSRTDTSITCTATHLSEWTLGGPELDFPVRAKIRVFLQGPYEAGSMDSALGEQNRLPSIQPYGSALFDGTPMSFGGTEEADPMPDFVVDWILVELRGSTSPNSVVGTRAGLLQSDGTVTDLDGTSRLAFEDLEAGDYYIVLRHRNHLPVMSASPVALVEGSLAAEGAYDWSFVEAMSRAAGYQPQFSLGGGHFAMIAADPNGDGRVQNDDKNDVWLVQSGASGYLQGDFNLDGTVDDLDRALWRLVVGRAATVD